MNDPIREWKASSGEVVRFKQWYQKRVGCCEIDTYEEWAAQTAQAAKEYLNTRSISGPQYYLLVETPEGTWGKDIDGVYREGLSE